MTMGEAGRGATFLFCCSVLGSFTEALGDVSCVLLCSQPANYAPFTKLWVVLHSRPTPQQMTMGEVSQAPDLLPAPGLGVTHLVAGGADSQVNPAHDNYGISW